MKLEEIKALIEILKDHGISRLSLKEEKFSIELETHPDVANTISTSHHHKDHEVEIAKKITEKPADKEENYLTCPMVGTFYSSPSPDQPPFVRVGDHVKADTVVCIVEAMKVMNEVKAGRAGIIKEIFLENAQPVAFGTRLFRIA